MKYDRNLVATIIENEFWDDLYNEIDDSVMNMEGQELDEAFETYVDYAESVSYTHLTLPTIA